MLCQPLCLPAPLQPATFTARTSPRTARPTLHLPPTRPALQAAQALELVTAALLDVVAPSNCLSLFNVAVACGCMPLRHKARRLALRSFPAAWQQDVSGLLTMPERELLGLLCSDSLQVRMRGRAHAARAALPESWPGFAVPSSKSLLPILAVHCWLPGAAG